MKKYIQVEKFINEKNLKKYFDRLYPICRSILGKGFRDSLEIIQTVLETVRRI